MRTNVLSFSWSRPICFAQFFFALMLASASHAGVGGVKGSVAPPVVPKELQDCYAGAVKNQAAKCVIDAIPLGDFYFQERRFKECGCVFTKVLSDAFPDQMVSRNIVRCPAVAPSKDDVYMAIFPGGAKVGVIVTDQTKACFVDLVSQAEEPNHQINFPIPKEDRCSNCHSISDPTQALIEVEGITPEPAKVNPLPVPAVAPSTIPLPTTNPPPAPAGAPMPTPTIAPTPTPVLIPTPTPMPAEGTHLLPANGRK